MRPMSVARYIVKRIAAYMTLCQIAIRASYYAQRSKDWPIPLPEFG